MLKILKLYQKDDPFKALILISPKYVEGEEDVFADVKNFIRAELDH